MIYIFNKIFYTILIIGNITSICIWNFNKNDKVVNVAAKISVFTGYSLWLTGILHGIFQIVGFPC